MLLLIPVWEEEGPYDWLHLRYLARAGLLVSAVGMTELCLEIYLVVMVVSALIR